MRLDINLATQPYEDAQEFWRRWGAGLAGLGVVTLVLLVLAGMGWYKAHRERTAMASIQQGIAALDARLVRSEAVLNRPDNRTLRERSTYLNNLFQQKAFSWTKVLEDLERVMPPRLHVVSIKPEINSDNKLEIKLQVAGDSRERAQDLTRRMEDSQRFQQTRIVQESSGRAQTPGDEVQFEISTFYGFDAATSGGGH
jgi:type IV pilus assembly protein PilN